MTDEEAVKLGNDVAEWFSTGEGKKAIDRAIEIGTPLSDSIRDACAEPYCWRQQNGSPFPVASRKRLTA